VRLIEQVWFDKHKAKWLLVPVLFPFTLLFWLISTLRRIAYKSGFLMSYSVDIPIIVVGNIGVGGNGKTPIVVYLVELAQTLGLRAGVISRGYGGKAEHYPYLINEQSTTLQAGDEPILIYQRTKVPVVVGPNRVASAQLLVEQGCDIIISDDGLQHYRLQRDLEIIVMDGKRLSGNGLLLPAGPLREGHWRLKTADLLIYNGGDVIAQQEHSLHMKLAASELVHIKTAKKIPLSDFLTRYASINAAAGIGSPQRFFDTLELLGFTLLQTQGFVDHKDFTLDDFVTFKSDLALLMTEKDAVKCQAFALENWWYLPVNSQFSQQDQQQLKNVIQRIL
jgi:tetraacyldisaccharide 4'-kinase